MTRTVYRPWIAEELCFLHMDSKNSDQTEWMPRLWVHAQADLSHCWAQTPLCCFCYYAAQNLFQQEMKDFFEKNTTDDKR